MCPKFCLYLSLQVHATKYRLCLSQSGSADTCKLDRDTVVAEHKSEVHDFHPYLFVDDSVHIY